MTRDGEFGELVIRDQAQVWEPFQRLRRTWMLGNLSVVPIGALVAPNQPCRHCGLAAGSDEWTES